jgi:hypothetical protein
MFWPELSAHPAAKRRPSTPLCGQRSASVCARGPNHSSRAEVYWQPRSELSRIRLNSDYAEVCVKPRICIDDLCSWESLADFSA